MTGKERRIKITHIHKQDAFYKDREKYIGHTGTFALHSSSLKGYFGGLMRFDRLSSIYFYAIRYVRI